jgi:hypothetical protein
MTKILNYCILVVSAWLIISPFILGYSGYRVVVCIILGIIAAALAYVSTLRKVDQWPSMSIAVLGVFLILWGAFIAHLVGVSAGANEIIIGILLAFLSLLALPFQIGVSKVEFYNRSGGELATFSQIRMKNGDILAKAMLLGSMPETIYMRPEEICKAVALMDTKVILSLPAILFKGWRINRSKAGGKV